MIFIVSYDLSVGNVRSTHAFLDIVEALTLFNRHSIDAPKIEVVG